MKTASLYTFSLSPNKDNTPNLGKNGRMDDGRNSIHWSQDDVDFLWLSVAKVMLLCVKFWDNLHEYSNYIPKLDSGLL